MDNDNESIYEVETRVFFESKEEAYSVVPFLKKCLTTEIKWETTMYGLDIFYLGSLLRVSDSIIGKIKRIYLGYKEVDIGKIYNVRKEIDEEITEGIANSRILEILCGKKEGINPALIKAALEEFGHKKFMSFSGTNLVGNNSELDIALKLMSCPTLRYPLILEIEKTASCIEEAIQKEVELSKLITSLSLETRVLIKEPPTLLFDTLYED
ncbi:MAG TPA: hypothetical protein VIK72_06750 [Clostridiaceae bacterium]